MKEVDVLESRNFFSNIQVWPAQPAELNPKGWLDNFEDGMDRQMAVDLLESFIFFNASQVKQLLRSAFHAISAELKEEFSPETATHTEVWNDYRRHVIVTYPADRAGSSGSTLARLARTFVASKSQVCRPEEAIDRIASASKPADLVLLDDLAATGTQFTGTWIAKGASKLSFYDLQEQGKIRKARYLPAICTATARINIQMLTPGVVVNPAHTLSSSYCASDPDTILVRPEYIERLDDFLRRYTRKAGLDEESRYGYGRMGLAIGFEHGTPDNALAILKADRSGNQEWIPFRGEV